MCALEATALEISNNGDSDNKTSVVTEELIAKTLESLEDTSQKDFIQQCLKKNPTERPGTRELLFHSLLFEVHSLKLLAAHIVVQQASRYLAYSN